MADNKAQFGGLAVAVVLAASACTAQRVPDPRTAAQAYAQAAERGDSAAIYAMMTREAQRTYGREGTKRVVERSKKEIAAHGKALRSKDAKVEARARVRFADGEQATLTLRDGEFRIGQALAFPSGSRTPQGALAELRSALSRRSYPGLMRVLTSDSRNALDTDLKALVEGLERPEALDIQVNGDKAQVTLQEGHVVKLKREDGVWRIEDFN